MDFVLTRLQAALAGLARKAKAEPEATPTVLNPALQLPNIQVFMARRNSSMIPVHLMVDGISTDLLLFKTTAKLREGDELELESLFTGVGRVVLHGRVEWLLNSRNGYTGQVTLRLDEDAREKVHRFVTLQSKRSRG
jgi:hypothetical protein